MSTFILVKDEAPQHFRQIMPNRRYNLREDELYARVSKYGSTQKFKLYLGRIICDLVNFNDNDYVNLFEVIGHKNKFLLRKGDADSGYKLSAMSSETFLYMTFKQPRNLKFIIDSTQELSYDFYDEESLIIDIEKILV